MLQEELTIPLGSRLVFSMPLLPATLDNRPYCDRLNANACFDKAKRERKVWAMGRRGRKREYNGKAGEVIRFVKAHPEWSYARAGEVFGVTRQAVAHLILGEERRTGM